MIPTLEDAKRGREDMKLKCMECALLHTPDDLNVVFVRKSLSGRAAITSDGKKILHAPRPITRKSLYIFLHECAHLVLGHCKNNRVPSHRKEFEAERWAHMKMRECGIAVPKEMTIKAKRYVRSKIKHAVKSGAKYIDRESNRFAGSKSFPAGSVRLR